MQSISLIINRIHTKLIRIEGYQRAWIEKHWEEIVGSNARKHSITRKIKNKILYISVDSSVWNHKLFIDKKGIIDKINRTVDNVIIDDIKFQMGNDNDFYSKEEHISAIQIEEKLLNNDQVIQKKLNKKILLSLLNKAKKKGK